MRTACRETGRQILCNGGKRLKVTAKITKNFTDAGKLKAFATVCLADAFLVTGVRVVACEKGITVFMPSMRIKRMNTGMYASRLNRSFAVRSTQQY